VILSLQKLELSADMRRLSIADYVITSTMNMQNVAKLLFLLLIGNLNYVDHIQHRYLGAKINKVINLKELINV
jgi:hypothetical protein